VGVAIAEELAWLRFRLWLAVLAVLVMVGNLLVVVALLADGLWVALLVALLVVVVALLVVLW